MMNKKTKGFTLIELLVVVSVISILSVILIRLLNIDWHRSTAEDSVRKATVEKIVQGIEAFGASEGAYPDLSNASDVALLAEFVEIPADYSYHLTTYNSRPAYTVYTDSSLHEGYSIVYFSVTGSIRTCSDNQSPGDESSCDVGD